MDVKNKLKKMTSSVSLIEVNKKYANNKEKRAPFDQSTSNRKIAQNGDILLAKCKITEKEFQITVKDGYLYPKDKRKFIPHLRRTRKDLTENDLNKYMGLAYMAWNAKWDFSKFYVVNWSKLNVNRMKWFIRPSDYYWKIESEIIGGHQ